jgi:hypothetical protein
LSEFRFGRGKEREEYQEGQEMSVLLYLELDRALELFGLLLMLDVTC